MRKCPRDLKPGSDHFSPDLRKPLSTCFLYSLQQRNQSVSLLDPWAAQTCKTRRGNRRHFFFLIMKVVHTHCKIKLNGGGRKMSKKSPTTLSSIRSIFATLQYLFLVFFSSVCPFYLHSIEHSIISTLPHHYIFKVNDILNDSMRVHHLYVFSNTM